MHAYVSLCMFGLTYHFEYPPALLFGAHLPLLFLQDFLGPLDGLPLNPLVLFVVQPGALL